MRSFTEPDLQDTLAIIADWYFSTVYGRREGPGLLPAHCCSDRVGHFAVSPDLLRAADASSLFKLLAALSMFQALRDVVIQRQQLTMPEAEVQVLAELDFLRKAISAHPCPAFLAASEFARECSVYKSGAEVDCHRLLGTPCPVKQATVSFRRMGDIGKLPSSALLLFWNGPPSAQPFETYLSRSGTPLQRAEALVEALTRIHRMGEKLATMYVTALSTPALFGDCSPWYPGVDGNELVVVDTNVAGAIDLLRAPGEARTYKARALWLRERASELDLRSFNDVVPSYSPRLLQQAIYSFCSRSNRTAAGDPCALSQDHCSTCAPSLCPFASKP